jgi:hypothetical protein
MLLLDRKYKGRLLSVFTIGIVSMSLMSCSTLTGPCKTSPLVLQNCPKELPPLTDNTFGATTMKLIEVSGIYHKCREAAVNELRGKN